jgi:hypothetical protein
MEKVKLKANLILDGQFYKYGSVLDIERVPMRLRKHRFILREGEVDEDAQRESEAEADVERMESVEPEDTRLKARRRLQRSI